jgi:hypothetical protein
MSNRKLLVVYGNDGKVLLKLPGSLEGFDSLGAAVKARLAEYPSPHAPAVRWRKARRTAIALLVGTVFTLAGSAWTAWMAYDTHRARELMRTQGVDREAVVVRKFVAPDGRTHRIEYRVAGAGAETGAGKDAPLHNVEVDPIVWAMLQTGGRVPVKTVPGHPEIARLSAGEIEDEMGSDSPTLNLVLSIALFVMGGVFLVGAILGFKGIEIATDPQTKKLKIERLPRPPPAVRHPPSV